MPSPEAEIDLQESVISDSNWETRSWLDYSFQRDIHSVPSSLADSWVNLDFTPKQHTLESTTPDHSCTQLEDSSGVCTSSVVHQHILESATPCRQLEDGIRSVSSSSGLQYTGEQSDRSRGPERPLTSTPNLTTNNSITLECAGASECVCVCVRACAWFF